ncbi:aldo/keto reductase [candidate division KSB1 bacterium]|nr:aldo/keto reductase [candidate division KSB1 bacterium]
MKRRNFLIKSSGVIGAGLALSSGVSGAQKLALAAGEEQDSGKIQVTPEYRVLGKTGMKVTTVSYGAMRTTDPAVLHRALDLGINLIDTAHGYQDGNNEIMVGKVMKERRGEAYVCTKIHPAPIDKMETMFEESLKRLQMNTVDILYYHNIKELDVLHNEDVLKLFNKWKKEGKTRFIGFSTHKNEAELLEQAAKDKAWDVILVAYNFKKTPQLTKAINAVAKAGIGVVGMKTQAGGYKDSKMGSLTPHQASLKWVLQNPNVHTTIPSMTTFEELNEDIQVMGQKMGRRDHDLLERYGQVIDPIYCRSCNACTASCRHGVDIPEINRCLMYVEGYGDFPLAMTNYAELSERENLSQCSRCSECAASCIHGIDLPNKIKSAMNIFA